MFEVLVTGILPDGLEKWIQTVTEMPIQVFYLTAGYMGLMDLLAGLAYRKRRQLREKYLGKTALFYCFDVNPKVRVRGMTETAEIIPTWKAIKQAIAG